MSTLGVNGILSNSYSPLINGLTSSSQAASTGTVSDPGGDSGQISPAGQLFSKLEQLKTQDPAKFKQLLSQIANQLNAAAQQQGQGNQAQFLTQLAGKFQNAAQTGDLTSLQPAQGAHHHHHAQQAYGQNQPDAQQGPLGLLQNAGQQPGLSADTQQVLSSILTELNNAVASS